MMPFAIAAAASGAGLYIILLGWAVRSIAVERRKTRGASRGALGFVTKNFRDTTYFWIMLVSLKDLLLVMSPAVLSDPVTSMNSGGLLYAAFSILTMIALPYTDKQAIAHALAELLPDHEIVLEVVKQDAQALESAAAELLSDRKIMLES